MVTGRELTEIEKECLAKQIRQFLLDNDLWQDVSIYFNGKEFSTSDDEDNFYYNDPSHLIVLENKDPRDYFKFVASNHILSMSFEGDFCHCLGGGSRFGFEFDERILDEFEAILDNYDIYYELGDHWNLTCYYKWK